MSVGPPQYLMHEFSIGQSLVDGALKELAGIRPPPRRLVRVRVVAGALHQIVEDNLQMAYEVLTRDTPAEGSELEIRTVPITARCRGCAWEGEIRQPLFLCGACGSGDLELITGRELYLENLEIERDDD